MSGDIDKNEIRNAIDRLQMEHPVQFPLDVTKFDDGTDFTGIQIAIDVLARKCQDDAEINIICEMAKLYLDGVKPTVERPHGEWIPCSERLPKAGEYVGNVAKYYLVQNEYGDMLVARYTHSGDWEQIYQLKLYDDEIVAWMPLPEPYKKEGEAE